MVTYVNDLRLSELATGEGSGTWGTTTNTNLELIGEALGYATEGITTNADTHATTVADGSTDAGRAMYIKYTGTLDSACTITIGPNTMSRVHLIENATSGSQNIIISQGSGANVTIPNGYVKVVYLDGAGSGAAVTEAFTDLSVSGNLLIDGATPTLTIGDAGAEDTKIVFDGNAQDFYIGLDDSADDLIIGLGSTVGTTPIISVDENKDVAIPDGGLTITTSDNTAQLALVSTDADANIAPLMQFYRNSSSPADNDQIGRIEIYGENDADEKILYGEIINQIKDASDGSEDGRMAFNVMTAGTAIARMDILPAETVFNQGGYDVDFRVESDDNANMFVVDASEDRVGIGTSTPSTLFHIDGTSNHTYLTVEANAGAGNAIKFVGANTWTLGNDTASGVSDNSFALLDGSTKVIDVDNAGHVTMPLQPAFSAQTSAALTDIATDAGRNTVKFGTQIFDLNADFNTTTFQFTAPVAGKYQLNTIVYAENSDAEASYIRVEIMTSNRNYTNIIDPEYSADRARDIFTLSVLADMDASDTAHIDIGQHEGTAQMDVPASPHSNFSGFLVC